MTTETPELVAKPSAPSPPASAEDGNRKDAGRGPPKEARTGGASAERERDANKTNEDSKSSPKDESQTKPRTPWWQSGPWVSLITALIAAIAPSAAALHSYFRAEGELKLAQQRQQHEVHSFYFKLAVEKDSAPEHRQPVLRYLARDNNNPLLQGWAQAELVEVTETLRLQKDLAKKEAELNAAVAAFEAAKADEKTKEAQLEQAQKEKEGLSTVVRTSARSSPHARGRQRPRQTLRSRAFQVLPRCSTSLPSSQGNAGAPPPRRISSPAIFTGRFNWFPAMLRSSVAAGARRRHREASWIFDRRIQSHDVPKLDCLACMGCRSWSLFRLHPHAGDASASIFVGSPAAAEGGAESVHGRRG